MIVGKGEFNIPMVDFENNLIEEGN